MQRRVSESEAQRTLQRLAAGQQREANCRSSETKAERAQRLAANQQRVANRRASVSEAGYIFGTGVLGKCVRRNMCPGDTSA